MNNVISFLEQLGTSKDIANLSKEELSNIVKEYNFDETLTAAIMSRDIEAINKLLDTNGDIVCFVIPAEDEEKSDLIQKPRVCAG